MLQNDRIHEIAALHAALCQEIEVAVVRQEIEALFGHHEASAAHTLRRADEFQPTNGIRLIQIFCKKSDCCSHCSPLQHSVSPNRVLTRSNACWFGTWNTTETSLAGARHSIPNCLTVRSLRPCVGLMPARVPLGRVKVSSIWGSSFPVRCVMPQVMAIHVPGRLQTSRSRLTRGNYKRLELARGLAVVRRGMQCRRNRAEISADAVIWASGPAGK